MTNKKLAGGKLSESTQKYLDIAEVKDDVAVLKDGSVRAVLLVSSTNFALKGSDEQQAIIQAYVGFLNSLDFPLQIVIQSRNLNIDKYLAKLEELGREQENELLRMQIADYRSFLAELLDIGQIMTKKFYAVVPYSGLRKDKKKFYEQMMDTFSPARTVTLSRKRFGKYKDDLDKRVDYVASGLASVGLAAVRLDTQSLIELYYNSYNPEIIDAQKLADVNQLRMEENI